MKPGLKIGDHQTIQVTVTEVMKPDFARAMNDPSIQPPHALYGTGAMITQMEWAARQHILPYLEPCEEWVGAQIQVQHLHPVPMDAQVTVTSEVIQLSPRRITSQVRATVGDTVIGEGKFVQVMVHPESLYERANRLLLQDSANADEQEHNIALLRSIDQQTVFSISLLRWESPFPCTRYDEWLICRLRLSTPALNEVIEGPYLLRFEIEELLQALKDFSTGESLYYQSDYMESALQLEFQRDSVLDPIVCCLGFQKKAPIYFKIDRQSITPFCKQLLGQLEQLLVLI